MRRAVKKTALRFDILLEAFNDGYYGGGWAKDWPCGVLRWAFQMGRRQRHGKALAAMN